MTKKIKRDKQASRKSKKQQKSRHTAYKKHVSKLHQREAILKKAEILNDQGVDLIESGQYEAAIKKLKQALRLIPGDVGTLCNYGAALTNLGQYEAAIEKLEQALQYDPHDVASLSNYSRALFKLGQYEAAITKLEEALRIAPDDPKLIHNYSAVINLHGIALRDEGQYEAALEKHKQALHIDPDNLAPLVDYGGTLFRLGHYEAAVKKYELALQKDPYEYAALNNYAVALISSGHYHEAIEKFVQNFAMLKIPQNCMNFLYLVIGSLYYSCLHLEAQGKQSFEYAIEHSQENDAEHIRATVDLLAEQSSGKAIAERFKELVKSSPDYADAFEKLRFTIDPETLFDMLYDHSEE